MSATITNTYEFRGMNADDMKIAYKRLVKKLHPDVSGYDSTNDMKILNGEFSYYQAIAQRDFVYNAKVNEKPDSKDYYYSTYHSATFVSDLASAIEFLLNRGIFTDANREVDICGIFVWIFDVSKDETALHEDLRTAGFHFKYKFHEEYGKTVPAWYYTPNYRRVNSNATVNQQRNKYGSQKVYGNNGLNSGD